ncbi:MAG: DUF1572 family protein [Chitinophagaceae bacterium]
MLLQTLQTLFTRDLNKLKGEILSYKDEHKIWHIDKFIANSAGNLCLHLVGNLNAYIGAELGGTNYIRQRDLEFTLKDIPRAELIRKIDNTVSVVQEVLGSLSENVLEQEYPALVFDKPTSTGFFLVHLSTHLAYHVGQVNYHRRLLDAGH